MGKVLSIYGLSIFTQGVYRGIDGLSLLKNLCELGNLASLREISLSCVNGYF